MCPIIADLSKCRRACSQFKCGARDNPTLAYLSARNKYRIEREEKSGKGFVDFIFYPRKKNLPGIILELKADKTPGDAIAQIQGKEYCEKLKKAGVAHILAVGINYDTKAKEHQCMIEELG